MNRELIFLRTFAVAAAVGMFFITTSAFQKSGNQKFSEIDVERINIVEKDGTVKMVITNVERFPNGSDKINGTPTNEQRKKRSGMLFFNEDGIECGGFLMFNDRPSKESQTRTTEIMKELEELGKKDPKSANEKYKVYEAQGLVGGSPRVMLGKSRSENNGLFLFDNKGMPKAMFYVDKENNAKLDFFDEKGGVIASFPEKKK